MEQLIFSLPDFANGDTFLSNTQAEEKIYRPKL